MELSYSKRIITSVLIILGIVAFFGLVVYLRQLLMLFFLAFTFASALNPSVKRLSRWKFFPAPLAILLLYSVVIAVVAVLFSLTIPPLIRQTAQLLSFLSKSLGVNDFDLNGINSLDVASVATYLDHYYQQYSSLFGQLQNSITTFLDLIFSTFSFVFIFFTLLISTFYFLLNMDRIALSFAWLLPGNKDDQATEALKIMNQVQHQLGSWVSGQLFLMFVIGLAVYVGLVLLGVPYALPLALLAGVLEIVPNVGPTVAAIPSIAIAFFFLNPLMGLATFVFYILIQQLENNLIVPFVMKGAVDVRPLTTLILILVGFELLGVIGALLVVPFYITVRTFMRELWPNKGPFTDYSKYIK